MGDLDKKYVDENDKAYFKLVIVAQWTDQK